MAVTRSMAAAKQREMAARTPEKEPFQVPAGDFPPTPPPSDEKTQGHLAPSQQLGGESTSVQGQRQVKGDETPTRKPEAKKKRRTPVAPPTGENVAEPKVTVPDVNLPHPAASAQGDKPPIERSASAPAAFPSTPDTKSSLDGHFKQWQVGKVNSYLNGRIKKPIKREGTRTVAKLYLYSLSLDDKVLLNVGFTKDRDRLNTLDRNCDLRDGELISTTPCFIKDFKTAESLVKHELHNFRHRRVCKCDTTHIELFDVKQEHALRVLHRWAHFAEQQPWDDHGELKPFWRRRLEMRREPDSSDAKDREAKAEVVAPHWDKFVSVSTLDNLGFYLFEMKEAIIGRGWQWMAAVQAFYLLYRLHPDSTATVFFAIWAACAFLERHWAGIQIAWYPALHNMFRRLKVHAAPGGPKAQQQAEEPVDAHNKKGQQQHDCEVPENVARHMEPGSADSQGDNNVVDDTIVEEDVGQLSNPPLTITRC